MIVELRAGGLSISIHEYNAPQGARCRHKPSATR